MRRAEGRDEYAWFRLRMSRVQVRNEYGLGLG